MVIRDAIILFMDNAQLISLLDSLVSTPSVTGNEKEIVDKLSTIFTKIGFSTLKTPSGSICGVIDSHLPGPTVLIDSHVDTVGIPDTSKWHYDPFKLTKVGPLLYGRGTSDMKGGLSAAIAASSEFVNRIKRGRIVLSCVVEEERFEGICAREVTEIFKPDYVIIAESTHCMLNIGQRGRCEIELVASGKSCHSSNPEEGENAIYNAIKAIEEIKNMSVVEHPILGKGIMVLTDIISSPYPAMSIIPEKCTLTYDRRTLIGETEESVIKPINELLERKRINAKASIRRGETTSYTGHRLSSSRFFPSWLYSPESLVVRKAKEALEESNLFLGYGHYSFCTNGSHYAGEANIPTIGYGPGEERMAHIVDEHIEEEDLYRAKKGLKAIIASLLS